MIVSVINKFVPRSSTMMTMPFPWWDRRCQEAWSKKEAAWRRNDMASYAKLSKKATHVYNKALCQHQNRIRKKLAKGTNSRHWWQMTKDITGFAPKKQTVTPKADTLAKFFTERFCIPNEESAELPDMPDEEFESVLRTFRVKQNRIRTVLKKLDESKSVGLNGVSPRVLKQCAGPLSKPITRLFQKIVRTGIIPQTRHPPPHSAHHPLPTTGTPGLLRLASLEDMEVSSNIPHNQLRILRITPSSVNRQKHVLICRERD